MTKKHKDLQPWLDYFDMLQTYEQKGFLQLQLKEHEAYVTQPALFTLTPEVSSSMFQVSSASGDSQHETFNLKPETCVAITDTVRYIQGYAAFRSTQGKAYMEPPFAIHVVQDEPPHDPIYTLVITHRKSWRTLWQWRDNIEVINYQSEE